jgi:hypothetical protein
MVVPLVQTKAVSATVMGTGIRAQIREEYNHRLVLSGLPDKPPHSDVSVIKIEFADEPRLVEETDTSLWLEGKA